MARAYSIAAALILCACGSTPPAEQAAAGGAAKADLKNPCSVLLPSEVTEIFGVTSNLRETVDETTCHYHFELPDGSQLKAENGESFIRVQIHPTDGRTVVLAHRLTGKIVGGSDSGFEQLQGIGDEAWMAPFASFLAFSKGDVGVEIDLRLLPGEREKAIELAKRIAGRI